MAEQAIVNKNRYTCLAVIYFDATLNQNTLLQPLGLFTVFEKIYLWQSNYCGSHGLHII